MPSLAVFAVEEIAIEAKEYDKKDAFVIYHSDQHNLEISYNKREITIKSKLPMKYRIMTPVSIGSLTQSIRKVNPKTVSIKTKLSYKDFEIVRGEKLTAIRFKTDKTFKKNHHKINPLDKTKPKSSVGLSAQDKKNRNEPVIIKQKDQIRILFEFDEIVPAAAYVRGKKIWIVFDKKKIFSFPANMPLKRPRQLDSTKHTILSFDMFPDYIAEMFRMGNVWNLVLSKAPTIKHKEMNIQKMFDHYGVILSGPEFETEIAFKDPDIGDSIEVFTTKDNAFIVKESRFYSDFVVQKSILGAVVSWIVQEHNSDINKNKTVSVYSYNDAIFYTDYKDIKNKDFVELHNTSSLPQNYEIPDHYGFIEKRSYLYNQVAAADNDIAKKDSMYELAKFFFTENLFYEANASLKNIDFNLDFVNKHPEAILVKAVTLSMLGYYEESNRIIDIYQDSKVYINMKFESEIFKRYNKLKLRRSIEKIGVLNYLDTFMKNYNDSIYWKLVFADIDISIQNNDLDKIQDILRKVRVPETKEDKDTLNFYKATLYRRVGKYDLANNYFDEIQQQENDPKNLVRATLEKVKMQLKRKEITSNEAIKILDSLKYIWRGDQTEFDVLEMKVNMEYASEMYLKALKTYKYMLAAFPRNNSNIQIANQMADIYNKRVFTPDGLIKKMSDFEAVSFYYEFKDLTPIGRDGDDIVLYIANRMINLNLLDEAEKMIAHQVRLRLDGLRRIVTGDHLAAIYIKNKKPQLAVDIINETDLQNYSFLEHIVRQRIKAKAFLDLEKYEKAIDAVEEDTSQDAQDIRESAYFNMEKWDKFILVAESAITPYLQSEKAVPPHREKEVLRLAIAYSMVGNDEMLDYLVDKVKTENKLLKSKLKLIQSTNEPINIRLLETDFKASAVEKNFDKVFKELFSRNNELSK